MSMNLPPLEVVQEPLEEEDRCYECEELTEDCTCCEECECYTCECCEDCSNPPGDCTCEDETEED